MNKHYYGLVLISLISYYHALAMHESPANQYGDILYELEKVGQELNKAERLTKHLTTILHNFSFKKNDNAVFPLSKKFYLGYQDYADHLTTLNQIRYIRVAIQNGKQQSLQERLCIQALTQQIQELAHNGRCKLQRSQYNIQRLQKLLL